MLKTTDKKDKQLLKTNDHQILHYFPRMTTTQPWNYTKLTPVKNNLTVVNPPPQAQKKSTKKTEGKDNIKQNLDILTRTTGQATNSSRKPRNQSKAEYLSIKNRHKAEELLKTCKTIKTKNKTNGQIRRNGCRDAGKTKSINQGRTKKPERRNSNEYIKENSKCLKAKILTKDVHKRNSKTNKGRTNPQKHTKLPPSDTRRVEDNNMDPSKKAKTDVPSPSKHKMDSSKTTNGPRERHLTVKYESHKAHKVRIPTKYKGHKVRIPTKYYVGKIMKHSGTL